MSNAPHDKLARWLEESSPSAPAPAPEGLEPDVVEAVYALRPELAPAPRVDIDDILAELTEGPLAPSADERAAEARAAAAFAALLDGASLDDDDLDDEAVEGLLALRPEHAPAPRVDLDDIFTAVTEGPFAQPDNVISLPLAASPAEPAEEPAEEQPAGPAAEVVDVASARRRRAWWALPGLGALAAAAAALLVVQPMSLTEAPPRDMALDGARYAPAPVTSTVADGEAAADPVSAKPRDTNRAQAPEPAAQKARKDEAKPTEGPAGAAAAPAPDPEPEPELEPTPEPASAPAPLQQAVVTRAPEPEPATGDGSAPSDATLDQLNALGYVGAESQEDAEGVAFSVSENMDADMSDEGLESESLQRAEEAPASVGGAIAVDEAAGRSIELRPSRRAGGLFGGGERASASAPAEPSMAPEMDDVAEEEEVAADMAVPVSMMALRERASRSFERVPSVAAERPELAATYAEVDALVAAGDLTEALARLDALRRAADPDVALDVAWRRCDLYLRRGLLVPAIAALDEGLQVIGGDPRLRARALYQKGQLLERRGDVAGATAAYQEAARLR